MYKPLQILISPYIVARWGVAYTTTALSGSISFIRWVKNYGKKEKSPHGNASFATDKELKKAGHLNPDGFLMGVTFSGKRIYSLDERNVVMMAFPGVGKSQHFIANFRALQYRPEERLPNLLIGDAANQLFRETSTFLQDLGYDVSKIDLQQPDRWNRYDPLVELRPEFEFRYQFNRQIDSLCELVVPDEPNSKQPHFVQFARLLLKCVIIVNVKYEGNNKPLWALIDELLSEEKREDLLKRCKPYDDTVVQETIKAMQKMQGKPEGISMMTTSLRKLEGWQDEALKEATTAKLNPDGSFSRGWSFREILTRDKQTAIFLRTGMEKNGGHFARVVYGCCVNAIGEVMGETDAPLKRRIEIHVDEGGLTGYCNAFVKGYARYRKAGLRLRLCFVSHSELMSTYGEDGETMWDGFNIVGFGGGNGMNLNNKLSELAGKRTIYNRSRSESKQGESQGWSEQGVPLFSGHDIRNMADNELLLILDRITVHCRKPWQKVKVKRNETIAYL